jgi:oxalate decarboxylase
MKIGPLHEASRRICAQHPKVTVTLAGAYARTMDFPPATLATSISLCRTTSRTSAIPIWHCLEVFPTAEYRDISLGEWLAHIVSRPVNEHVGTSEDFLTKISKAEGVIAPEK